MSLPQVIINGRKLSDEILAQLKREIAKLPRTIRCGAVLVGKNSASESFLKQKAKVAEKIGVNFETYKYARDISTEKLIGEIKKLNRNKNINGIIVQLPLPKHVNTKKILTVINPKKDIDALSEKSSILAPTAEAVKYIFQKYKINYKNKNILIVGRGRLVGRPIYNWLTAQESSRNFIRSEKKIKIIDIKQKNQLPKLARKADIIIGGAGNSEFIKGDMIKRGAILIDFGFSHKNGPPNGGARKISGDFDFESCAKKAKFITPVPGGMGPIMVAMLFRNLFKLNKI